MSQPTPTTRARRWWVPASPPARHLLVSTLALVAVVVVCENVDAFRHAQLAAMAYYAIAAAGLTVLTGLNGQISLGHGALMAVGAYTTALLLRDGFLPFGLAMLAATVITALVGIVVGAAAARLTGPYLAGATLALAVGLPGLAVHFDDLLGGEQGLAVNTPTPAQWFDDAAYFVTGTDLGHQKFLAYVAWGTLLLVLVLLANLTAGRYGRMWRAVRDDEVAAALAGVHLGRARILAFVVSAACAGLAGSVLAMVVRLTAPSGFTIVLSLSLLTAVVVGGLGSLPGAVLGSALLVFLPPAVTDLGTELGLNAVRAAQLAPLVYGIVLVAAMLAAPSGVAGLGRRVWSRVRNGRSEA
ncbi:branched-chain amino acid ABC transporter permease [Saccharomonospora azurea]|uniref:ABC-type branched-chain amino acid transport system, permease component n=1 Tax=Saccharomonospora azurea NA-128 TaxID=882081 RepID=H8GED6_9PSEU|nr:branched-chain amino acid ABC transporter permease [Saccharomonospora azurea]EHY87931.1 ABC-type branched-chain amino acid transport system, permease component [Saccharomonospora azurea NA-128]